MQSQASWDDLYSSKEAMVADMQCFQDCSAAATGGSWWKRGDHLLIAGNASESAFAASTPGGYR